ncbi:MAG: gliding motility-associated C-terminal domain-containing protein [Bacteroidia bacterium]|nr:gliding motility-associated C-terminal domain-containing protein [Bacteroidia bacterium]
MLSLLQYLLIAQTNLVPNGSFEIYSDCPKANSAIYTSASIFPTVQNWMRPTTGTPDYFNACNLTYNTAGVPANEAGYQFPNQGNAYVGLINYYNFSTSFDGFREYLQVKLLNSLVAGTEYEFTYYLSPTGFKSVANVSGYFSVNKFEDFTLKTEINVLPQVTNNAPLTDTSAWYKISGSFKATGGEEWLIMGNFLKDFQCTPYSISNGNPDLNLIGQSYIFIDDVSLIIKQGIENKYLCNEFDSVKVDVKTNTLKFKWFDNDSINRTRFFNKESKIWITNFLPDGSSFIDSIYILKTPHIYNKLVSDSSICDNENLSLILKSNIPQYIWSNGSIDSFTTYNKIGKYWLKSSENGCLRIDTFLINAKSKPTLLYYPDTFFCNNSSLLIGNNFYPNNYKFLWNNSDSTKQILVNKTSQNILAIKDTFCWAFDTIQVSERPLPMINILGPKFLCSDNNDTISLVANLFSSNIWFPQNGKSNVITISKAGKYWHTVTDNFGCTNTDTVTIKDACTPLFYMPNAFTPNGNNLNDFLNFKGKYIDVFNIKIFNRWGEIVFESNDFECKWEGTFQGNPLPMEVYFYTVIYSSFSLETTFSKSGTFTLLR